MDQVPPRDGGKVEPDCSGGGIGGVRGAQDETADFDGVVTLPDHGDDWTGRHVLNETWEDCLWCLVDGKRKKKKIIRMTDTSSP